MRISDWSSDVCSSDLTSNMSNNPFGAYVMATLGAQREINEEQAVLESHWNWGNGYYPEIDRAQIPTDSGNRTVRRVITPAYVTSQITLQALTSGFRQLENADEIGEIISSTFAGLSNQIMTAPTGFSGLSGGGVNSYLNQDRKSTRLNSSH